MTELIGSNDAGGHKGGKLNRLTRALHSQVTKPEAIVAILECLGLPSRPPPINPARASPETWLDFEGESA